MDLSDGGLEVEATKMEVEGVAERVAVAVAASPFFCICTLPYMDSALALLRPRPTVLRMPSRCRSSVSASLAIWVNSDSLMQPMCFCYPRPASATRGEPIRA